MPERLAVLGSPISHSLSPALHSAAYRQLGLDWSYERFELGERELEAFLNGPGRAFRGLSATMPLKAELLRLADEADEVATRSGAANTAIGMPEGVLKVFNTDVAGITRALAEHGMHAATHAVLLGGGATAASAMLAFAELGVETVDVRMREPQKAGELLSIGRDAGLTVLVDRIEPERAQAPVQHAELLLSTLPGGGPDAWASTYAQCAGVVFDVAYDPWPSELGNRSREAGAVVISGLEMLMQQALVQVRVFVSGDPREPLPDEAMVLAAMRNALPAL